MVSYNKTLNTYDVTLATAGYVIGAGIYTILGVKPVNMARITHGFQSYYRVSWLYVLD